jgi:hypothetical protein
VTKKSIESDLARIPSRRQQEHKLIAENGIRRFPRPRPQMSMLQECLTNSGAGYIDRLNRSGWWE